MNKTLAQRISILNKTVLECFGAPSEKYILKKFIDTGISVLGADFGCSWLKVEDGTFILGYKSSRMPYTPKPPRRNDGVNARIQRAKAPLLINDVWPNPEVKSDSKPHMRAIAGIPIIYKGKNYGNLIYCFKKPHKFTAEEKSICEFIGNSTAQAIAINKLYADLKEFRYTLDHTRDPMLMLHPESLEVLYANRAAVRHLALPEKQLLGKPVTQLPTGLPLKSLQDVIEKVKQNPAERQLFETEVTSADQGPISVEVSLEHIVKRSSEGIEPRLLATVRNITDLKKAEREIKQSRYYDKLTGLPNRSYIMEELPNILEQAKQEKRQFAVIFADLDKFKFINDMLGHSLGDALLVEASKRLWDAAGKQELVARTGGNEFIMVLNRIQSVQDVERVATAIQSVFEEPFMLDEQEIYVSVSLGISVFPGDGSDVQTLLRSGHAALRWVKEAGGGAFRLYYADIASLSPNQLKLEQQLRQAARKGQLVLHYVPQVSLATGKLVGAEALLRWNHPERGLILPEEFLARAEDNGFIVEIGYWIIREAVRQIKEWQAKGKGTIPLTLNLSRRQLVQQGLAGDVSKIIVAADLDPRLLSFELAETTVMKDLELAMTMLNELRGMGIKLVIDKFGRGYTSLSYLQRLPIDTIKIDEGFIQGISTNKHDDAIVTAMISMAHDMHMSVVAEGVDTQVQAKFLAKRACDIGQGSWFSKPVPAEEFASWAGQLTQAHKLKPKVTTKKKR